jgi:hypothetical protein
MRLKRITLGREIRYVDACFSCPCCQETTMMYPRAHPLCVCGLGSHLPEGKSKHELVMPDTCRLEDA